MKRVVTVFVRRDPNMKKRLLSLITIIALAMTFVMSFAMTDGSAYAAGSKKYYLPKEVKVTYYGDNDGIRLFSDIKYDKHDNLKSLMYEDMEAMAMVPVTVTTKYKNSKGKISAVTVKDNKTVIKKTYNAKGCVKKVKLPDTVIKTTSDKNGIVSKVTVNGNTIIKVKSIKFHKNGFVKKVVYDNGAKNYYNEDGLLTSAVNFRGDKFSYRYTVKNGKVTKVIIRRDGKKVKKFEFKYSKKTTKDVWKYSCMMCYFGGPSNACELYAKGSLGGIM